MHTKRSFSSLSSMLKHYRTENGLTQEALAERSGVSVRTLAALETGTMHMPRLITLRLLAEALELTGEEMQTFLAFRQTDPPPGPYHAPPTNLPAAPTPLIGREQVANQALHLLRQANLRLLTLVGMAGVGKTRLAMHVAHRVLDDFPDGVFLIELAALTQVRMVEHALYHHGVGACAALPARYRMGYVPDHARKARMPWRLSAPELDV